MRADWGLYAASKAALEALVRQHPQQYLWGYARYKAPVAEKADAKSHTVAANF